ncbi:MAG TPA: cellulose synthase subunit BcsC-related outer membrane protein [Terracidiphilus sp.]|nr:cellulose synthase subunit BcsC-related outer membrane protein [Terracidiphilus sp.]
MTGVRRVLRSIALFAACLAMASVPGLAQKPSGQSSAQPSPEKTRQILEANARALESRGRPDMAIQIWRQILLSDPNNSDALAGLARDYKLNGNAQEADKALGKLRDVNPNDPRIAQIESLSSTQSQSAELRRAGDLARQGRNEDAMKIYRQLYGDHPPDGDIGLAYYQTLYGTTSGKEQAIAGMRAMATRNPTDSRYEVELGRMLTYDPKTRAEGIHILERHPQDSDARNALRQALIWNSANPATAGELRAYLKEHPQDTEIATYLKQDEAKLAQMNSAARNPEEREAFAALNAHKLDEAEKGFMEILQKDPKNGRASAGMGFVRMQQQNFGAAVSYLTLAEQNDYKPRTVEDALETSRFWYTMGEASQAFDANQFDVAAEKYRAALAMRPRSADALNGLAGLLVKEQQYSQAAAVYDQLIKVEPANADAWRGLFLSYARDGDNQKALAISSKFPPTVRTAMGKDPEYLRTLATIYQAEGRTIDAQKVLSQALALPFPEGGQHLKEDTRLQYAGILMEAHRFDQAAALYTQILNDDANSLPAWMGLVSAHHELGQDAQAISDVERMPPSAYESALSDSGFLIMLGSIYQQANQFDIAQSLLERAVRLQTATGKQPAMQLELQLAAIYLQRGNTAQAYAIYRQVLTDHPDRIDAWKGLIATLQGTNHTQEALQQLGYIPPAVRAELEKDPDFVTTEASIYASAGDTKNAMEYIGRVQKHFAQQGAPLPPDLAIQNAWLLYNTGNDRALYPALMQLGSRLDLTVPQREAVQTIWASWSVRRAGAAIDRDDNERAVEILEAAQAAFPENLQVKWILAGGYLRTGQTHDALVLYKRLPIGDATSDQFQGAIGAALSANDRTTVEAWLRIALEKYPRDYKILGLAAKFEQARGDNQRAADYWRAAIAAMPANSPTDQLAHELAYPDEDTKPHKARTAGDLQLLLNPDYAARTEPFAKTVKLPPLPAYGPDPTLGTAPIVVVQRPEPIAQQTQAPTVPESTATVAPAAAAQTARPRASRSAKHSSAPGSQSGGQAAAKPPASHRRNSSGPESQSSSNSDYAGHMDLPASEEHVTNTAAPPAMTAPAQAPAVQQARPVQLPPPGLLNRQPAPRPDLQQSPQIFIPKPQSSITPPNAGAEPAFQLSSEPMNNKAAAAQAEFAQQTDGQLTQGSAATQIRPLGNAPVLLPDGEVPAAGWRPAEEVRAVTPVLDAAQYTPSAQEAATGAYSAQRQQQPATQPQPAAQPAPPPPVTHKRKHKKQQAEEPLPPPADQGAPTLGTAPTEQNPAQPPVEQPQQPAAQQPAQESNPSGGLTDEQLQDRNLPPLRGPWVKVQREPRPISPRQEAEQQLQTLESGYSAWLGGNGVLNYRSGTLGYDRLTALEAPFEWTTPLGYHARFAFVAKPVFLDSGQADGTSVITVQEATTAGRSLVVIPQPLGTQTNTGPAAGSTFTGTPPAQQNASGIAGELQLITPTFAIAGGYTPYGFLVANWTGRVYWRPGNGRFTLGGTRDSIKDSQLSYGGLRDPGTASLSFPGTIWGGVVADQGNMQYARGDALSGFYFGVGGQYINGFNTKDNYRIDGNGGAYWRVKSYPEYGSLSIGANFFAMHYQNNQDAFTFGMGGYFSPQIYLLANVPITWAGHYQTKWHYEVVGGFGVQAFQQDLTPLYPLPGQKAIEIALNNAALPALTSVGPNYDFRATAAYQIGPHWFAGGFMSANNSRNYDAFSVGFSVHYMFRSQPSTVTAPTGNFPLDGLRPFTVP